MELSEKTRVQENIVVITSKKKGNSKASQFKVKDDDDDVVSKIVITGKKKKSKSKKGGSSNALTASSFGLVEEEGEDGSDDDDDDEFALTGEKEDDKDDSLPIIFAGRKQSKSLKKGSFSVASAFDALDDENDEDVIDNEIVAEEDINDEPDIAFAGKKSSKSCKKNGTIFTVTGFSGFGNEDEDGDVHKGVEDVDITLICFSDKKKKSFEVSKKIGNSFSAAFVDEENDGNAYISEPDKLDDEGVDDEDTSFIAFSGKKKSSKMKSSCNSIKLRDESGLGSEVRDAVVLETLYIGTSTFDSDTTKVIRMEGVAETSEKKKKSGKTAQEDDDLDKILAELGEGPPISKPFVPSHLSSQEDKVEKPPELVAPIDASAEKKAEEESKESATARKKKKKKEKEKEKKAAAAAVAEVNDEKIDEVKTEKIEPKKGVAKSKMPEKKVPKHVRDIQEAMAKRKDEEERRKRKEEERLRKDEEGRLRQEELERQAEEAKRRKKEREKEKLLRKKQEGKLLTGKQKEVKRRLESMRNQILANAGVSPHITSDSSGPAKRPIYQTKKTPPGHHQATGSVQAKLVEHIEEKTQENVVEKTNSLESEKIEAVELLHEEEKSDVIEAIEDDEDDEIEEDEDEWDANSWDDVVFDLSLKSACADEEFDSEPEIVMKNDRKNSAPTLRDEGAKPACLAQKTLPSQPIKSPDIESKRSQDGVEVVDKDKRKDNAAKKKTLDATLKPEENLRSPICCIIGHVDAGKTKLLDCIRGTNVQEGEARGIAQQIGATYFPAENIRERTRELKSAEKLKFLDLLVIDTPGHESFTNLRSRGSGLCDIAILVVDIMHGLEPQTIESLELLRMRNTEFIVALNKVDRLYGWKTNRNAPILKTWKQQSKDVQNEFNIRLSQIITEFKEQGLNSGLYDKKKEMGESWETSYIVPTSAVTGEGIPDLLLLLGLWAQKNMTEKLMYSDEVQCTVLEVKVVEGHGTTIDVILVNGVLHEGDQIVVCGMQGPIVTTIRALLTPHPMKELRVKGTYLHHKEIKAAQGIKITGQGLEHAISGTGLYVVGPDDNLDAIKDLVMEDMKSVLSRIDKSGEGICVQASTIGSLEALLAFLKSPAVNIPISGISIGPVHEKDVKKASVMLEKKKEYAVILAFDVKVTPKARELADELGVKIFIADVIYHLFDQFKAYIHTLKEEKKKEAAEEVVFPCVLKILPNFIFKKKNPILLGVDVIEGIAKVGTPICIPQREFIDIGRIASIKINDKPVDYAKKGQQIAIKLTGHSPEEQQKMYGRHFDSNDELVSHISRKSIDVLKTNYRDDLSKDEWRLLVKLKILFKIQ